MANHLLEGIDRDELDRMSAAGMRASRRIDRAMKWHYRREKAFKILLSILGFKR